MEHKHANLPHYKNTLDKSFLTGMEMPNKPSNRRGITNGGSMTDTMDSEILQGERSDTPLGQQTQRRRHALRLNPWKVMRRARSPAEDEGCTPPLSANMGQWEYEWRLGNLSASQPNGEPIVIPGGHEGSSDREFYSPCFVFIVDNCLLERRPHSAAYILTMPDVYAGSKYLTRCDLGEGLPVWWVCLRPFL